MKMMQPIIIQLEQLDYFINNHFRQMAILPVSQSFDE